MSDLINNREKFMTNDEKRQQMLRSMILKLHDGVDPG